MRPALVLPMHDPGGTLFPLLQAVTPTLKQLFDAVYCSVTQVTAQRYPHHVAAVAADSFFHLLKHTQALPVGEDFRALYQFAATNAPAEQLLHLAFIDRVVFALQTAHREQFIADITQLSAATTPVIFARSNSAWQTHPRNYHRLETMVTDAGEMVLSRRLDFCWCHVALLATDLRTLVLKLQRHDLSICAELILLLDDHIQMQEVDWLAWEDPFILGRDGDELRREREASPVEVTKRLGYVVPMLQLLQQAAANRY